MSPRTPAERLEPAKVVGPAARRPLSDPEWRLKRGLRIAALTLYAAAAALLAANLIAPTSAELREPPWVAGALAALVLLATLAAHAAGDPRRRRGLIAILAGSLAAAALLQLAYRLAGTGDDRPLGAAVAAIDHALIPVAALELALATAVVALWRSASTAAPPEAAERGWWPSAADAGLRPILLVGALLAAALALAAAAGPFVDDLRQVFSQPLLSAHAAAGAAAGAALCVYIAVAIRDRLPLVSLLSVALMVSAVAGVLAGLQTDSGRRIEALGVDLEAQTLIAAAAAAALALAAALAILRRIAAQRRLRPRFLWPTAYRALMALSDVIVQGPDQAVPPPQIAANVDGYLERIRSRRKLIHLGALLAMELHPVLSLQAPFSELDEETRLRHLQVHFHDAVGRRLQPEPLRRFVQALLRISNQLTYIGYYSDHRSFDSVGYRPFSERPRHAELVRRGEITEPGRHPLEVERAPELDGNDLEADYCVIGSGAAGAILAHRLAAHGSVIVLERGEYVEPREFSEDEVEMIGRLYGDGVFQQSEDFRFTVLQGSCVGGSTVVNNAVSIPLPERTLALWNERHGAGIDPAAFEASTRSISEWLRVTPQDEGPANPLQRLNPSAPKFLDGIERHGAGNGELRVGAVPANLDRCLGCGYCNIGCRFGRKLSMLDTVLPWAQRDFGPERVRIIADCPVTRIVVDRGRPGFAKAVEADLGGRRRLRVRAKSFVLAAGAVASPYLLQRSRVARGLPVGHHASFNMGAPLTAEFDEDLDAYDGLQISHVAIPPAERGWVMETWWNPPVSQALNMPGWFDTHYENMRRYRRLMAVGALVGTERNARIGHALTGGPAVHYVPSPGDLRKLCDALIELGRILFAGGARAVMVNGWEYHRFTSPNGLYELPAIMRDPSQLALGTGHPQGGNAIGSDPGSSVVDPSFRVHGCDNVYVCDASVFPTSITVNPQLTVMALANYAAPRIAGAPA